MKDGMISAFELIVRFGAWAVAFMMPMQTVMYGVIFLTVANFLTALWKAKHQGTKFVWAGLMHSIFKTVAYQAAITVTYVSETIFFNGLPVTQVVGGFIAVNELKSSLENLHAVTGLDFWSNIKALFAKKMGKSDDTDDPQDRDEPK